MLVGLADILASPRGYHLYLRIVVHLGHVLGIHLLFVVGDEVETVSSSAFFSWLSSAAIRQQFSRLLSLHLLLVEGLTLALQLVGLLHVVVSSSPCPWCSALAHVLLNFFFFFSILLS